MKDTKKDLRFIELSHKIFLDFCSSSVTQKMMVSNVRDLADAAAEIAIGYELD